MGVGSEGLGLRLVFDQKSFVQFSGFRTRSSCIEVTDWSPSQPVFRAVVDVALKNEPFMAV